MSEDRVKVRIESDSHIVLNGANYEFEGDCDWDASQHPMADTVVGVPPADRPRKRRREASAEEDNAHIIRIWIINKSQWRLRLQKKPATDVQGEASGTEIVMVAVKLDATSNQKARNAQRSFLSP